MLLLGACFGASGGREDEGRSLPPRVDQSLSLFGLDEPMYIAGNYLTARVFGTGIL